MTEQSDQPVSVKATLTTLLRDFLHRSVPNEGLRLPKFVPGKDDPQQWANEISEMAAELGWSDTTIMAQIGDCFEGEAGEWFKVWSPIDRRSWANLKVDICESFAGTLNFGKLMYDAISFTSNGCSTFSQYARLKLQKINCLKLPFSQSQIISMICFGIADVSLQAQMIQAGHSSVTDLISHLCRIQTKPAGNKLGHSAPTILNNASSKIPHQVKNTLRCYNCGLVGHPKFLCPQNNTQGRGIKRERDNPKPGTSNTCDLCEKPGHTVDKCFAKKRQKSDHYKKINMCHSSKPISSDLNLFSLNIDNHDYQVLIDTGAQVSLLRQSVVKNMCSLPVYEEMVIKGVGTTTITSKSIVNVKVNLEKDLKFPLKMHIVSDDYIPCDAIIGLDFVNIPGIFLKFINGRPVLEYLPPDNIETQLQDLLLEFKDISTSGNKVPTPITTGEFKIRLTSDAEIKFRPYRFSIAEKETIRNLVGDLLENGIIRPSNSPYASPAFLVQKKNGGSRLVCDFRALNRITVKDRFPLPRIDDQIDLLSNKKYFTTLDMAAGFHQIKVHPDSVEKLAFITPDGQFEYLRMPFGLANAPSIFQRAINIALRDEITKGIALVYMDDILIPTQTKQEGLENLRLVLTTLKSHGFSVNINKCKFLQEKVEYLGRLIENGEVKPSPSKIETLKSLKPPSNAKEVRQFLGLAGYLRKFIPQFSVKTKILSNLLKKDSTWKWTNEHTRVFNDVIQILSEEPVLAIFNPDLPLELHTDASSRGYGAIIFQNHDGVKKVVSYFSKATTDAESRYHSYELETLAVVNALKHFRHYFVGVPFKLVTDCNALKNSQHKRDLLPRVSRWWIYLQDFDFTIVHKAGDQMAHVDYLSRSPPILSQNSVKNVCVNEFSEAQSVEEIDSSNQNLMPAGWLFIQQNTDSETAELKQKLQNGELDKNQFCIIGSTLCHLSEVNSEKVTQYFVPKNARYSLIKEYHDGQAHIGLDKTILSIASHFWFPRMRQFIKKYIDSRLTCLTRKRQPRRAFNEIHSIQKIDIPFHTIHIDLLGPLPKTEEGFTHVFVAVDAYSKYTFLYAVKSLKTEDLTDCVQDIVFLVGTPARIITDNGSSLKAIQNHLEWNIEWHFITPYVHQSNGQVERYMRFVSNLLRVQANCAVEWSSMVSKIQLVINSTVHKTTKRTPLQTLFGCDNRLPEISRIIESASDDKLPLAALEREKWRQFVNTRLSENASYQENYGNKNASISTKSFNVGDFVLISREALKSKKLESGWVGPYKITQKLPNSRYELRRVDDVSESIRTTVAVPSQMRLWIKEWVPDDCAEILDSYLDTSETVKNDSRQDEAESSQ
ncbi:unnamed protein product [Callosobruchus maculatus]|uniref:RNA-directed DNA polymerase n=1 Tax=Callosobruchus maculatus TaxID=64391 RepID=A0A653D9V7_CALMS|nr:unnamed protein product [Callosobruchus maculatus]